MKTTADRFLLLGALVFCACSSSMQDEFSDLSGLDLTGFDLTGFPQPDMAEPPKLCDPGGLAKTAQVFVLPPGYSTRALAGPGDASLSCDNGANDPSYSTIDLDGDGKLDLVFHDDCKDMAVGTTKWLLHKGTGTGFAEKAVEFPLPAGYSTRALAGLADGSLSCDNGANDPSYSTVDMDGDGKPDLVFHDNCTDMSVGTSKWLVHKNIGSGFAAQRSEFSLPSGYSNRALAGLADASLSCDNGANDPSYSTVDLDADGKPDLVFHDSCKDMAVGTTRWLIHKNTGTGFAAAATEFELAKGYSTRALSGLADASLSCDNGANDPSYSTVDLDGDGKLDLVFHDQCTNTSVGTTKWLLHKNTGSGFAPNAIDFPLPPGYSSRALAGLFDASLSCDNGANDPSYSTLDLDGDRRPELIFHDHCQDTTVGTSKWRVHKNSGNGFEPTHTDFALPEGYSQRAFNAAADATLSCDNGANDPSYSMADVDGDRLLDLLIHDSCTDMAVGTTKWLLHKNVCKQR